MGAHAREASRACAKGNVDSVRCACVPPQEAVPFEAGSALRGMHPAEAPLHRDRVYGERLPAELPPRAEREAQEGDAAEHVPGHM